MKTLFPLPTRLAGPGRVAACVALVLAISVSLGPLRKHKPQNARPTASQIYRHAATIAATFGELRVLEPPASFGASWWSEDCRVDDLNLHLIFDPIGRLRELSSTVPANREQNIAPIRTGAEAQQVALHLLRAVQMLPADTRLVPVAPPKMTSERHWYLAWQAQVPHAPELDRMVVQLDRNTGVPLLIWWGEAKMRLSFPSHTRSR